MKRFVFVLSIVLGFVSMIPRAALGQASAFTYQGLLKENNLPVNGVHDFSFTLHNTETGGTALSTNVVAGVSVSNGLFSATIDFGNAAFSSGDRWLEIATRPSGPNAYSTLTPREKIAAAPYATFASSANAGNLIGSVRATNLSSGIITSDKLAAGAITLDKITSTNVFGFGPTGDLHVKSISTNPPALRFEGTLVIARTNLPSNSANNVSILEMPKVEREFSEYYNEDRTTYQFSYSVVTPIKVRRPLSVDATWKDWMRAVVNQSANYRATVSFQFINGRSVVLGQAFPVSYQVERGLDGLFYETLTMKAETYSLQ